MGGWNIKNLQWFSIEINMKRLWWSIFGKVMWCEVLHGKYIKRDVLKWIRNPIKSIMNVSNWWCRFIKDLSWISRGLFWKVGKGSNVLVVIDPVIGI